MGEYITLLGAEDVRSAANTMRQAADQMQSAASMFDHSLTMHHRFLDDWLHRLQSVMENREVKT